MTGPSRRAAGEKRLVEATFRSPGDAPFARSWQRKNNRLPAEHYVGNAAYSLTLVTAERKAWFTSEEVVGDCESVLQEIAETARFELLAYVFMPEHMHLLAQGREGSMLPKFIKDFKQRTGFHFKLRHGAELWQKSYHDHILRSDEDLNRAALYIANNPVRRRLVMEWPEYPYWGGVLLRGVAGDLKVASTSRESAFGDRS